MGWYISCIALGIVLGLVISRYLPPMIQFKGKVKQKGRNNNLTVKPEVKVKKQRLKRLFKRKE